jgi:hypothetical protein
MGKFRRKFHRNSTNSENSRKNFLGKIPGKFPENYDIFTIKCNDTAQKSIFFIFRKVSKPGRPSGKFRGKFSKCQKFPGEISPENFPEIPGVFFGQIQCYRA